MALVKVRLNGTQHSWILYSLASCRQRGCSDLARWVTQGGEPVGWRIDHPTEVERVLALMHAPSEYTMVMPDSQQRQHPARQRAMHRQMRAQDGMPALHGARDAHRVVPGRQQ